MSISATLLPEFDQETANARRMLERVPAEHWDWKPHQKSWSLGQLANHLANLLTWTGPTLEQEFIDVADFKPPPVAANPGEVMAAFDRNRAAARTSIEHAADATMMSPWSLRNGGQTLFTMPKAACVRSFVMNHLIHHRAQLGVYLRLLNVPVPGMYGPTADEPM